MEPLWSFFLGLVLDSSFARRPQPSGSAPRRSPLRQEVLQWRPALPLLCPPPVPTCSPSSAPQQHWHQATGAATPDPTSRARQERVAVERQKLCMHQALVLPGRAAGMGLFSSAHRHCPCRARPGLRGRMPDKEGSAGSFILFQFTESPAPHV